MKRILIIALTLVVIALPAMSQEAKEKPKATDSDKIAKFDSYGKIKRGSAIGNSETVALAEVMADPSKFAGETVKVEGYVVRSCKREGCWAQLGATPDATETIQVTMKDHAFFIPLKSAGFKVLAEGVFAFETISSEKVKHLVEEDGAKFKRINSDGTVNKISFLASGIVLSKAKNLKGEK